MLPLPFLPGRHVRHWNRAAWLVITTVGLIGFVAVLLTPGSGTPSELHHVALVPLFVAFAIFALGSLAFMAYFHLRPAPAMPPSPGTSAAPAD
jgi:CHASE2 domain-containing sensor protein